MEKKFAIWEILIIAVMVFVLAISEQDPAAQLKAAIVYGSLFSSAITLLFLPMLAMELMEKFHILQAQKVKRIVICVVLAFVGTATIMTTGNHILEAHPEAMQATTTMEKPYPDNCYGLPPYMYCK